MRQIILLLVNLPNLDLINNTHEIMYPKLFLCFLITFRETRLRGMLMRTGGEILKNFSKLRIFLF